MKTESNARCTNCGRDLTNMMEFELNKLTCWCGEPFSHACWFKSIIRHAIAKTDTTELQDVLVID